MFRLPYPDLDTTTLVVYLSEPLIVKRPHPSLPVLLDVFFKVSLYQGLSSAGRHSALQVADTTIQTLKEMRNETTFKKFDDEASKMAVYIGN